MDTIVILDRIRENTRLMAGGRMTKIVNKSIQQTMTRSFNTLATVIITLVALLALGGASLKNFAFALLVGICSGGYHSIFYLGAARTRLPQTPVRGRRETPACRSLAGSERTSTVALRGRVAAEPQRRRT